MKQWMGDRLRCPYYDAPANICLASFSAMPVDELRSARYCCTEDHDRCAIFLARALRRSRPFYAGKQILELSLK